MKAELGKHSAVRESQVNSKGDQRVTRLGLAGGLQHALFRMTAGMVGIKV